MESFRKARAIALTGLLLAAAPLAAQPIAPVLETGKQRIQAGQASQKKVDQLAEEKRDLAAQYRAVLKEIEGLEVYNAQLERQVAAQVEEVRQLDESIAGATQFDRDILPLMLRMIGGLEQFVKLDVPFLIEERKERIAFLKEMVDRADVTVAEKFRRVLEAYQTEGEYGRTIEAYRTTLEVEGKDREVDVLRIGRLTLCYQTLDGEHQGIWNQQARTWEPLGGGYGRPVREGLRMARKQVAPDLLTLPVPAPQEVN